MGKGNTALVLAPFLEGMREMGGPVNEIFEAANEAGRQLVEPA